MWEKDKNIDKINVILDTDTYNECDDQFALTYMLLSQNKFNIEAITVAPYHHDNDISVEEGQEKSYQEILKICNWLNFDTKNKVFKGSNGYIENGYNETNEAVEKIINLCDLMCPQGGKIFTIDKRLIDIMIRRGAYSNTQYHIKETYKLKEYFDKLLGYNLYDLFPEIKENL